MSVRDVIHERADRYIGWLAELCSIPSLAEEPSGVSAAAGWVESKLEELGATTERLTYEQAPDTLLGVLGSGDRTVLIYDHYDVQPVDPIELWETKPFEPALVDGRLFARGAADNKGDLVARLAALEVLAEVRGDIPVRVKFLVEGEEETGSGSFEAIVARYGGKLAADGCIWEGNGIDPAGRPDLVFGAKGLAYVELTYRGLNEDQHSSDAVIAPSPVWHLVEALSTLRDPSGRVLIDGFYDDVVAPSDADMAALEAYPFEEDSEKKRFGIESFVGDVSGIDLLVRYFFEPTCNIAGIWSGYTVPGASKTVLPKEAFAKLDMRLVPEQDPHDVIAKLGRHLKTRGFGEIQMAVLGAEHPVRSPMDSAIGKAALEACDGIFDQPPIAAPLMKATGPMYPIAHTLGIPTVSPAGVYRRDSNIHAPNENIRLDDYLKVIEYTVAYLERFAQLDA